MSTSIAPTFEQSKYVSGIPLELFIQVGAMKQEAYNTTKQNIQSQLDILGSQQILKETDKEKFQSSLSKLVSDLNSIGNADLSDPMVEGKLNSMISSFSFNPEIMNIITDNKRAAEAYEVFKEASKDPKRAGTSNVLAFTDAFEKWRRGETGNWSDADNYFDKQDITQPLKDAAEYLAKNPDIIQEAIYDVKIDPMTGNPVIDPETGLPVKIKKGEVQIKQIKAQKVAELASTLMTAEQHKQLMLDYQYLFDKDPNRALDDIEGDMSELYNQMREYNDILSSYNLPEGQRAQYQRAVEELQRGIDNLSKTYTEIQETGDGSLYYTPTRYRNKVLMDAGRAFAFTQQGKTEYDDIYIADLKFQYDTMLETVKNQFAGTKGLVDRNGNPLISNRFIDNVERTIISGKGRISDKQFEALWDIGLYNNGDGSYSMNLSGQDVYLSSVPYLTPEEQENIPLRLSISMFETEYSVWAKKNATTTVIRTGGTGVGVDASSRTETIEIVPTVEEYLNTEEGQEVAEKIKKQTSVDPTDPSIKDRIKLNNEKIAGTIDLNATIVKDLAGQKKFRLYNGNNFTVGTDGNLYVRGEIEVARKEIDNIYGKGTVEKLLKNGMASLVKKQKAEGLLRNNDKDDDIISIPIMVQSQSNLYDASDRYMRNELSGDKAGMEALPIYNQNAKERISRAQDVMSRYGASLSDRTTAERRVEDFKKNTLSNMQGLNSLQKEQIEKTLKSYIDIITNDNIEPDVRLKQAEDLMKYLNARSVEDIRQIALGNFQNVPSQYFTSSTRPAPKNMEPDEVEKNLAVQYPSTINWTEGDQLKNIKEYVAASETGGYSDPYTVGSKGGSTAYGKYQFIKNSGFANVYENSPGLKEKYKTLDEYWDAYINSPQVQEDTMNRQIELLQKKYGNNPLLIKLAHYQPALANKYKAGKLNMNDLPENASGTINMSVGEYLSRGYEYISYLTPTNSDIKLDKSKVSFNFKANNISVDELDGTLVEVSEMISQAVKDKGKLTVSTGRNSARNGVTISRIDTGDAVYFRTISTLNKPEVKESLRRNGLKAEISNGKIYIEKA